jgi:hypothetical protein
VQYCSLLLFLLATMLPSEEVSSNATSSPSSPLWQQVAAEQKRQKQLHYLDLKRRYTAETANVRRITIECSIVPMFRCPTCHDDLTKEQWAVVDALKKMHPTATVVESTHKLINALYVNLPTTDDDATIDRFVWDYGASSKCILPKSGSSWMSSTMKT